MQLNDVEVLVGTFAAAVGTLIAILGMLNRQSRAHTLATESFALAEILEAHMDEDKDGEVHRVATQLRNELLARGHEACQDFLSRSAPKRLNLVEVLAWFLIWILLTVSFWGVDNSTVPWLLLRWISVAVDVVLVIVFWSTSKKIKNEEALALKRAFPAQRPNVDADSGVAG